MKWLGQIGILVVAIAAGAAGLYAGRLWSQWAPPSALQIGAPMIDFVMPDVAEKPLDTRQFRGRTLVINFWAPWCEPCIREIPMFNRIRDEYAGRVEFLGVSLDDPQVVKDFAQEHGIRYPLVMAAMGDYALMRAYGNERDALPFTVIVDAQGRLVARRLGEIREAELRGMLDQADG